MQQHFLSKTEHVSHLAWKGQRRGGASKTALRKFPIVSLFTGAGGLDLGFEAAGFETLCCVEIDPFSCRTLKNNMETFDHQMFRQVKIINKDIREVSVEEALQNVPSTLKPISLLIGGPPCQAFSVFGQRKGLEDNRGTLIWEFLRFLKGTKPYAFVMENVPGLRTIHGGKVYESLRNQLTLGGEYRVSCHEYEMADFGIPQFRRRLFFIGARASECPPMIPTHGPVTNLFKKPYVTVRKALAGLPPLSSPNGLVNHVGRSHSARIIERYRRLKFGERDPKTRINKLDPERPSFTIIVGSDKGGGKGHINPFEPREVTPRESARLQTFPDDWAFTGTSRHPIRQIGNAVPPLFSGLLAAHILKTLFNKKDVPGYQDIVKCLKLFYLE